MPVTRVDHNEVLGVCNGCHNGSTAAGTPNDHMILTSQQCDDCHSTSGWTPVNYYAHFPSGNYPGDHAVNPGCDGCHKSNDPKGVWKYPSYQPDCAGCHFNKYDSGEGRHSNISNDRNCAGGRCHRVTDRNWD
jgi:hypothetical protein